MKHLFLAVLIILFSFNLIAQPNGINYQGVARDSVGHPLINQFIGIRLSILDSSSTGQAVYVETHGISTSSSGLFNLSIGMGIVVSGVFANIPWGAGDKWMKIEMDGLGGNNFQLIGTTQFLSVPFALYSNATKKIDEPSYSIGDTVAGGIVFYLDGSKKHGLVCSLYDLAPSPWSITNTEVGSSDNCLDAGFVNSDFIIHNQGAGNYAALNCRNYHAGGFNDWYLPCIYELHLIYVNLKLNGFDNFAGYYYWSSNEANYPIQLNTAIVVSLQSGLTNASGKQATLPTPTIRAVRSF